MGHAPGAHARATSTPASQNATPLAKPGEIGRGRYRGDEKQRHIYSRGSNRVPSADAPGRWVVVCVTATYDGASSSSDVSRYLLLESPVRTVKMKDFPIGAGVAFESHFLSI